MRTWIMLTILTIGCREEVKLSVTSGSDPKSNTWTMRQLDSTVWGWAVYHDDKRKVTCWVDRHLEGESLSCIADSQLRDED